MISKRLLKNVVMPIEVYKIAMPWEEGRAVPQGEFDKNRIAVLPFANMSPDPTDEYFADGMTDETKIDATSPIVLETAKF